MRLKQGIRSEVSAILVKKSKQTDSAFTFILFNYIGLSVVLCNKIRAHIGATFVFQGETDFVKCRAQVCLSVLDQEF